MEKKLQKGNEQCDGCRLEAQESCSALHCSLVCLVCLVSLVSSVTGLLMWWGTGVLFSPSLPHTDTPDTPDPHHIQTHQTHQTPTTYRHTHTHTKTHRDTKTHADTDAQKHIWDKDTHKHIWLCVPHVFLTCLFLTCMWRVTWRVTCDACADQVWKDSVMASKWRSNTLGTH